MKLFGRKKEPVRNPRAGTDDQGYVFRRSRTLTGTTSNKVNPTAESRSQLKTVRLQAHELHQFQRRVARVLVVVMAVIAVLCYLLVTYISTIAVRYSQPGGSPQTAAYQQTIQQYFTKHPMERFGFSINRKQFASDMQAAHPELSSVDIDKDWYGGNVRFMLQFRHPLLVWETGGHRFYVDNQGAAFEYDHFGGKYVSVSDQSGISPSVSGGSVASNRFINFLGKMVGAVNVADKGQVTDIIIPASTREVDLKLQGRGYPIKTHTDRDPLQQAEDVVNAIKWFDSKKVTPQYVDVRVAEKAYFK
jgi:cell division septal protein FtsQ